MELKADKSEPVAIFFPQDSKHFREAKECCLRLERAFVAVSFDAEADLRYSKSDLPVHSKAITTGVPQIKAELVNKLHFDFEIKFETLIDPSAVIASTSEIGCGVHLDSLSVVASEAKISCHSRLNRGSSLGHDSILSPFVYIGPGATVCGLTTIGIGTVVGAGAVILPELSIGENVFIGAGSVVTKDIPDNAVAYGNPANVVRFQAPWKAIRSCPNCL